MMWTVPPTRYPASNDMLSVSGTTPSPANDASPCTTIGSTDASSRVLGAEPPARCRARDTLSDRIHQLEVARVRHELHGHRARARDVDLRGEAHVVLHVARVRIARHRDRPPLELLEQRA